MHSKLTKSLLVSTSAIMFGLVATSTVTHADTTNQTNPSPVVDPANQVKTKDDYQQDINKTQQQIQQLQNQQQSAQQQVTQDQNAQQEYQNNQQQLAQAQQTYQQNYTPVDNQNVSLPQAYIDGLKHASEDQQTGQQFRQIANPQVQTHAYTPDTQAAQENIDLSHLTDNQVYRANLFANGLVNRFRQSYGAAPIQQNADAQHYTQQVADALLKTGDTGHSTSLLDGAGENLGQTYVCADVNTAKQMQAVHFDTIKPSDIIMQNHVDGNKQWNTWSIKSVVMITTMDDLYADIYYNICQMLFNDSGIESWGHAANCLIYNTGKTYTGFAIEPIKTTGTIYIFTTTTYSDGHKETTSKPVQVPMINLITRWQYRDNTSKRPINPANDWNDQSHTAKTQIDKLTIKQSELKKTLAKAQDNQNQLKKINAQLSQLNNKLAQLKQAQKQAPVNNSFNDSSVITLPSHKPANSANNNANKPASSTSRNQAAKPAKPGKPANSANGTADKPAQPAKSDNASQSQAATPNTPASSSASQAVKPSKSTSSANNNTEKPAQPAKSDGASQAVKPIQPTSSANSSAEKPAQPVNSSTSQSIKPNTPASSSANQAVKPSESTSSANNTKKPAQPAKSDNASQAVKPSQPTSSASHNETVNFDSSNTASPVTISFPEEPKKTAVESQRPIVEFPSDNSNTTVDHVLAKNSKTSTNKALPQTGNEQHRSLAAAIVGLLVGTNAMAIAKKMKVRRQH